MSAAQWRLLLACALRIGQTRIASTIVHQARLLVNDQSFMPTHVLTRIYRVYNLAVDTVLHHLRSDVADSYANARRSDKEGTAAIRRLVETLIQRLAPSRASHGLPGSLHQTCRVEM